MKGAEGRSRERLVLLLLVVVGGLLRLGYLAERRAAPDFDRPVIDAGFHDDWARTLAFGEERAPEWRRAGVQDPGLATEPYLRPPAYPFLLAAVYRVTGGSVTAAVALQMLFGLVSVVLAWSIARRFGVASAGIAAGVMALHWTLIYFEGELLAPSLAVALELAVILALLRAADAKSRRWALAAGALLGLAVLTRPNLLALVAVAAPWLALALRRRGAPLLAPLGLFALGLVLAIAPVTLRNISVSGQPVLVTSNLGVNLWIGNHEGADGRITAEVAGMGRFRTCYDWPGVVAAVEEEVGREMTASDVSSWFTSRALDWIRSNPGEFAALTLRKAALFWGPEEISNNKDVAAEKRHSLALRWLPFPFPLLSLCAFAGFGLFLASRRSDGQNDLTEGEVDAADRRTQAEVVALVGGFALISFLSLLPFFATARFRVPLVPFLAILAGLLPFHRAATTTGRWTAIGVSAVLVALAWLGAPDGAPADHRYHLDRGRALYNQVTDATPADERARIYGEARVELEAALRLSGGAPSAEYEMGVLEVRMGRIEEARLRWEACARKDSEHALSRYNLGHAYEQLGDRRAAIESFGRAAALDRTDANAPFHQGRLLAREGEIGAAIGALRLAHERNPGMTQATNVLARYLVGAPDPALRDVDEGTRLSESLPREGPGAPAFEETRARAYAAAGRAADAESSMTRAESLARAAGAPRRELERLAALRTAFASGAKPWQVR
ncbi:MAG: glycosyltransferase family 39 protein [Planctomycetota bacterium]